MRKHKMLSYPLSLNTPLYGGALPVEIRQDKNINIGDSCNTFQVRFSNHSGTHIDAPLHFDKNGKSINEYPVEKLVFQSPFILGLNAGPDDLIDITNSHVPHNCDMLIIRTGFYRYRNKKKYIQNNPGISPRSADYVRRNFPFIRALMVDCISISPNNSREEGRLAHRLFLAKGGYKTEPILLIEDADLSGNIEKIKTVYVVPFYIEGLDSVPCTVFGIM